MKHVKVVGVGVALLWVVAGASSLTAHAQSADAGASGPVSAVDPGAPSDAPAAIPADAAPPETDQPSDTEAAPASRLIGEIIVTAQKREENLQDVPIAVQAFSADALDARGINTALDLPQITPGLTYNSLANYAIIYLRGVGTDAFIPSADLSVATYVDGVYFPASFGLINDFGGLERLEVLKGPQGTLFGRNSTGGAISITTKNPGREFESSAEVSYGNFDNVRGRVYTNVPLGDSLAINVAGVYSRMESYYDSTTAPLVEDIAKGVRVKVGWTPTDTFTLTLAGLIAENQGTSSLIAVNIDPKPTLLAFQALPIYHVAPTGGYDVYNNSIPVTAGSTKAVYGEALWQPGPLDIKLIGSHQDVVSFGRIDFDGTDVPLAAFEGQQGSARIKTGELQLLSNDETWGAVWLTSIVGLYYIESTGGFDPVYFVAGPLIPDSLQGVFTTLLGGPILPEGVRVKIFGLMDTKAEAAFFQTTAKVTDWFSLTLGGRYQTEKRDLTRATLGVDLPIPPLQDPVSYAPRSTKNNDFSPKISLDFRPWDDILVYASFTKGFKSGTYNIINLYTPPDYVKPEEVTAYELGLKTELLGGALRFNAAVFHNEIKNLQVQIVSLQSGGAVSFENAGSAEIQGAEFDALWIPLPNTLPGLVWSAGATYLDTEYTEFDEGSGFDPVTGLYFGQSSLTGPGRDFSGNEIARAPEFTGATTLSYTHTMDSGSVEVAGDYYYNSGYFFSAQNSEHSEQSDYELVNARISYLHEPWNLRLTVYGRNIMDTKYWLYQFETDFGTLAKLQMPATYGVRLNWDF